MRGACVSDGAVMEGRGYLSQCIVDALRTPVGSRVMRPSYGSRLFSLLDRGCDALLQAEVIAAIVEAVVNCVPAVNPRQVVMASLDRGRVRFDLSFVEVASGEVMSLNGVEVAGGAL